MEAETFSPAIASNHFELHMDYGFSIKGRRKASQPFVVQLSGDYGDYLPNRRTIPGGKSSALVSVVGPEGVKSWLMKLLN